MEAKIRAAIEQKLHELKQELEQFDQTTHGLLQSQFTITDVGAWLMTLYKVPSAYNNSSLIQVIGAFLKNK